MDKDGLGKVRFLGAWEMSKVLKRARKYVSKNLSTKGAKTRKTVEMSFKKIQAIEDQ